MFRIMRMDENELPSRILLIDDDDINNFIAVKLIEKAVPETSITTAVNGKEALEKLQSVNQHSPDLLPDYIFLDINMPVMDAWGFLKEFQGSGLDLLQKIKIFVVSSSLYSDDIERAKSYSCVTEFITKPLSVEKIRKIFEYAY